MNALLEVKNLVVNYGVITALQGISLSVKQGDIVTLIGANGAGKTTALRAISGLLKTRGGEICHREQNITNLPPHKLVELGIAHVPEGREIFPFMTVKGNLMMGAYARRDRAGIERDLDIVYNYFPVLRERHSSQAGYLSGGQQQMLAIGRALMARPKLMLLDEPSLGLSPILVKEIFAIIRRLNQEQKVTMLLVEQNANMALKTAHYGYVLEVGRIVLEGDCAKLVENEDVREFYLGHKETAVRGKKRWKRTKRWR